MPKMYTLSPVGPKKLKVSKLNPVKKLNNY